MKKNNFKIIEHTESSSVNKSTKADDIENIVGYKVSNPSNTVYSNESIKILLKSYKPDANIEVYLYKKSGDHVLYNLVSNIKTQLKHEIKNEEEIDNKFYFLIEQSLNNDLQVSSACMLKLCKKRELSMFALAGVSLWSLSDEFNCLSDLCRAPVWSYPKPIYLLKHKLFVQNFDYLIEILKLILEYESPFEIPEDKIEYTMGISSADYEKSHQQLLNILKPKSNNIILTDSDKSVASNIVKKSVSWDPMVKDNEGNTKRWKENEIEISKNKW